MISRYPFGTEVPHSDSPTLVKLSRRFNSQYADELKGKIGYISKLRHPSLISVVKAFESKSGKFFDVFYEYVAVNIRQGASKLSTEQLLRNRDNLMDLCRYLINMNIYPEVA